MNAKTGTNYNIKMLEQIYGLWYVFTLNNYTEDEVCGITENFINGEIVYLAIGTEVGEKGTPHLQGFFKLIKKVSIVSVIKQNSTQ